MKNWYRNRSAAIALTLLRRWTWKYVVIHRRQLTKLRESIALPLLCGKAKGKLSCPDHVTIVLIHNYKEEPIAEKSLRYVGIEDFVVLRPEDGLWPSNTVKLRLLKSYLDSDACSTEHILYLDSEDAVLMSDPGKAVRYLQEAGCDLLFSSTTSDYLFDYMPEARRWADQVARDNGCEQIYLNSGVYIGRTAFLREFLDAALEFVTDHDLSNATRKRLHRNLTLGDAVAGFPRGGGSDQAIFRHLHPRFYPRIKVDYRRRLALR